MTFDVPTSPLHSAARRQVSVPCAVLLSPPSLKVFGNEGLGTQSSNRLLKY